MPEHLLEGLRRFRRDVFPRFRERYAQLVRDGQQPATLFIGCADSRVIPELFTGAGPGELFHVRNMGAFVPPFESDAAYHGTSAAIEFATEVLRVTDIIVCGHTHCGAIRALYEPPQARTPHIDRWLDLAADARLDGPVDEKLLRRTEQRSIALQLQRLASYPGLRTRLDEGQVSLHGWHYVIEEGSIEILDVEMGGFVPMGAEP